MLALQGLSDFYIAVGAAVCHLQFLEDLLVTYVTARLKLNGPGAGGDALAVLDEQRRQTLGALMRDAKAGGLLGARVDEALAVLEERNWLIHRSMHEVSDTLYSDAKREAAVARVRKLADDSIALKTALYVEFSTWLETQGVDVGAAEAAGRARFRELRDA